MMGTSRWAGRLQMPAGPGWSVPTPGVVAQCLSWGYSPAIDEQPNKYTHSKIHAKNLQPPPTIVETADELAVEENRSLDVQQNQGSHHLHQSSSKPMESSNTITFQTTISSEHQKQQQHPSETKSTDAIHNAPFVTFQLVPRSKQPNNHPNNRVRLNVYQHLNQQPLEFEQKTDTVSVLRSNPERVSISAGGRRSVDVLRPGRKHPARKEADNYVWNAISQSIEAKRTSSSVESAMKANSDSSSCIEEAVVQAVHGYVSRGSSLRSAQARRPTLSAPSHQAARDVSAGSSNRYVQFYDGNNFNASQLMIIRSLTPSFQNSRPSSSSSSQFAITVPCVPQVAEQQPQPSQPVQQLATDSLKRRCISAGCDVVRHVTSGTDIADVNEKSATMATANGAFQSGHAQSSASNINCAIRNSTESDVIVSERIHRTDTKVNRVTNTMATWRPMLDTRRETIEQRFTKNVEDPWKMPRFTKNAKAKVSTRWAKYPRPAWLENSYTFQTTSGGSQMVNVDVTCPDNADTVVNLRLHQ